MKDFIEEARDRSIQWAREILTHDNVVYLDTETTGLDEKGEIIQIGIVDGAGNVLMDQLVHPRNPCSEGARKVHGITDADVADAPAWHEIYAQVEQILTGKLVVIYNADYDLRILRQSALVWGMSEEAETLQGAFSACACAMIAYAEFVGQWSKYFQSFRWQKLPGTEHGAVADCQATARLVQKMANSKLSTEAGDDNDLSE